MTKRIATLACALAAASTLGGCYAGFAFGSRGIANGFLWADTKSGEQIATQTIGSKRGEACSTSVLGLVTTGDSTYVTAAKNGGITKISTIDNRFSNILGVVATYCAVVTGE